MYLNALLGAVFDFMFNGSKGGVYEEMYRLMSTKFVMVATFVTPFKERTSKPARRPKVKKKSHL